MSRTNRQRAKDRAAERTARPRGMRFERLEPRYCLSASPIDQVLAPLSSIIPAATGGVSGYTPAQVASAYGFNQSSFGSVKGDGTGQTIAIVDAYSLPTIASDLHAFDVQFGLPDPKLTVANQTGGTKLPATNSGWGLEIALDVEWAHAMAPG